MLSSWSLSNNYSSQFNEMTEGKKIQHIFVEETFSDFVTTDKIS